MSDIAETVARHSAQLQVHAVELGALRTLHDHSKWTWRIAAGAIVAAVLAIVGWDMTARGKIEESQQATAAKQAATAEQLARIEVRVDMLITKIDADVGGLWSKVNALDSPRLDVATSASQRLRRR
jgi:hypothetical protein